MGLIGEILLVFVFGFCIDAFYIIWVRSATQSKKLKAGVSSVFLTAPALFGFYAVFKNLWLAIPYLLGLFFGTVITLYIYEKRNSECTGS